MYSIAMWSTNNDTRYSIKLDPFLARPKEGRVRARQEKSLAQVTFN